MANHTDTVQALVDTHARISRDLFAEDFRLQTEANDTNRSEEERAASADSRRRLWRAWEESGLALVSAQQLIFDASQPELQQAVDELLKANARIGAAQATSTEALDTVAAMERAVEVGKLVHSLGKQG